MDDNARELIRCQHDGEPVFIVYAGPTRAFLLCSECYNQVKADVVQSMLQQVATDAIRDSLGKINIGSTLRKPGW